MDKFVNILGWWQVTEREWSTVQRDHTRSSRTAKRAAADKWEGSEYSFAPSIDQSGRSGERDRCCPTQTVSESQLAHKIVNLMLTMTN